MTKSRITKRSNLARPVRPSEVDSNFNQLMYYSGAWSAGSYEIYEVVTNGGDLWVCEAASTTEEPAGSPADWTRVAVGSSGSGLPRAGVSSSTTHNYSTITSTWVDVNLWDSTLGDQTGGVTVDTNGLITLDSVGWYELDINMLLSYTSFAANRQLGFRVINNTTAAVGTEHTVLIPSQSTSASFSVKIFGDVTSDPTGQNFNVQWHLSSGTDIQTPSYTSATMIVRRFSGT